MDTKEEVQRVAVVAVPLPAQGHLNQLLHLSRRIADAGIPVHYVCSAMHVRQARDRACRSAIDDKIHFHGFPLPPFPSPPPAAAFSSTNFLAHLQPMFDASVHLHEPLAALLRSLAATSSRVVVLHDSCMSFAAAGGASLLNVESYAFHTVSAFALLLFFWESKGKPPQRWINDLNLPHFSNGDCFSDDFLHFAGRHHQAVAVMDSGRLINTCRAIEGSFLDQLTREWSSRDQKLFAVGPLNPSLIDEVFDRRRRHECMEWLDRQPPASVIYVSFGTTSTMDVDQINELAAGLETSGHRFIWVLRDADRADIYTGDSGEEPTKLSLDFDRRVDGVGMVIRGWAPQLEILGHPSTAGFMSHCGWNSCMESMSMGVPLLAWPMHSDQPRNTMLVTEVLKAGIIARDWAGRSKIASAATVKDAITRLMDSDEGKAVRDRAKAIGEDVRRAMSEGGSSRKNMDAFIAHITR